MQLEGKYWVYKYCLGLWGSRVNHHSSLTATPCQLSFKTLQLRTFYLHRGTTFWCRRPSLHPRVLTQHIYVPERGRKSENTNLSIKSLNVVVPLTRWSCSQHASHQWTGQWSDNHDLLSNPALIYRWHVRGTFSCPFPSGRLQILHEQNSRCMSERVGYILSNSDCSF